ncbi:MAG: acetylornithine deacetylase [Rhodobiaceae bacterium]|nr:acetylornithine deacetylase [Rhodobiaceae bacterium]
MTSTREILEALIGFASVSTDSNLDIIGWIEDFLQRGGFDCHRVGDATGLKAGIYAVAGPKGPGGLLLSAHSDVVPVEGQNWTRKPFRLTEDDGLLYGRGTTDMKGFLACALAAAAQAAGTPLKKPLKLAISYDEEIGCVGIADMIASLEPGIGLPECCIVGEPTSMRAAIGHKGKVFLRATCHGTPGHTAMAPDFLNALHLAADFISALRDIQTRIEKSGPRDPAYAIPYSTVHAARLAGGVALNIVPERAVLDFEVRHLASHDPRTIIADIEAAAEAIAAPHRARFPDARIEVEVVKSYPGLDTPADHPFVATVCDAAGGVETTKVAYGTEAGYFAGLGIPTVVCGPGDMDQGHKPDEFVAVSQLAACDAMLARLIEKVCR